MYMINLTVFCNSFQTGIDADGQDKRNWKKY